MAYGKTKKRGGYTAPKRPSPRRPGNPRSGGGPGGFVAGPIPPRKQGAVRRPGPNRPHPLPGQGGDAPGIGPDTLPGGPGFELGNFQAPPGGRKPPIPGGPPGQGRRPTPHPIPGGPPGQQQPGRFFQNRLEEAGLRLGQGGGIKAPGVAGAQSWNPEQIALMQRAYDRFGIDKNPAFDPTRTTYTGEFYDVPGGAMPQFISNTGYLSGGTNGQSFRPDMLPGAPVPEAYDSVIDPRESQGFGSLPMPRGPVPPLVNPRQPRSLLDLLG